MKIECIDSSTGKAYQEEAPNVTSEFIQSMLDFELTDERIKRIIDNLNISADAKVLLYSLSKATIKAGEYVLKIERKIIDDVCTVFKEHPQCGVWSYFWHGWRGKKDKSVERRIIEINAKFSPLKV